MVDKQAQGWHGDSKGHAKAAKGDTAKDTTGSSIKGQGWHGDSKGHAKAAKSQSKDETDTTIKKIFGSD